MRPASVPLWCMLVALASSLHIGEDGGVVPLGEGGPGGSYIPGLHSKARTAREARARNVRVETEAQGERIKAYDQTGSSANSITAPAPLDPWGKEATSWRDAVDTAADTGTPLSKAAKAAATNVAAKRLNKKMKASEATRTSKPIVPVVVNVVAAPDQNNEEAAQGSVSRAIAGNDARKFTKLVAQMDGDSQEVGDSKAASVNSAKIEKAKLRAEVRSTAYMQAEDKEDQKIELERAEAMEKEKATQEAIELKAAALQRQFQSRSQAAVNHVSADGAKRNEDKKAERVAEDAAGKGWLSPKLSAELVLEAKKQVRSDTKKLRADRTTELRVKKEAKMSEEELKQHRAHRAAKIRGKAAAQAANDKEMAMKFVKAEFERRKKIAYQEKLKDEEQKRNMQLEGEVLAKKDAANENKSKMKESSQKGKSQERRGKKKDAEKEAKVVAASHKPKPRNCKVGPWAPWSACSRACSGGIAQRSRSVKQATSNGGADCPALSQSKPCNTEPCLTATFGAGFCANALKKCTTAREEMKGCRDGPYSFGNGNALAQIMVSTSMNTEKKIAKTDPDHSAREDPTGYDTTPIPSEPMHATPPSQYPTSAGKKKSREPSSKSSKIKAHKSLGEDVAADIKHMEGSGRQPQVRFEFPRDKAPATIIDAVHAAERTAAKPGYDEFDFKIQPIEHNEVLVELDEAGPKRSVKPKATPSTKHRHILDHLREIEAQKRAGGEASNRIVKAISPGNSEDTANKVAQANAKGNSIFKDMQKEKCGIAQAKVAKYCGQMVDCVQQSLDTRDINYSKQLQTRLENAAKARGIVTTDDRATENAEDEARDEADEKRSAQVDQLIPPTRDELVTGPAKIPMGYPLPDQSIGKPVVIEKPVTDGEDKPKWPATLNTDSSLPAH